MFTIRYIGRIFHAPNGYHLESPTANVDLPEVGHSEQYHLYISAGVATFTCRATHYDDAIRPYVYFRCLYFTRACLALSIFATGVGGTVVYETCIEPNGREEALVFLSPQAASYCRSFSLPRDFNEILTLGIQNPDLMNAVIDLVQPISDWVSVALVGARALERIRTLVAGPTASTKKAWLSMQESLRVDEAYLKFITDYSLAPRHGQDFAHTPDINNEVMQRCWSIIDRCVEYLRRNRKALPADEFPLLAG